MDKLIESLSPLERKILPLLKNNSNLKDLIKKTSMNNVELLRALKFLENKNIIELNKKEKEIVKLDKNGLRYIKDKLPERRLLETLKKEPDFNKARKESGLDDDEFKISLGILKSKMAIEMDKNNITLTKEGEKLLNKDMLEELFLKKIKMGIPVDELKKEDKFSFQQLKKRKNIIKIEKEKDFNFELTKKGKKLVGKKLDLNLTEILTPNMLKTGNWKNNKFRRYDIETKVPKIYGGRRHFVNEAKSHIKKIWLDMGFKEMKGNLIQSSFWNFDALFVPQDHPARELQDTFFVKGNKKIDMDKFVPKVKKVHENSWKYKWDIKEAEKLVLRTHTTVLSAKTLAKLKKEDLPAKFFAVGKNFRNEAVDWSHLFELIQVEGIVVDEKANFRNLVGYLKEFFGKMGFSKVRVRPAFFPYTEPSAEVDVYHPIKKKWIELGGSGIFRPEVTRPLLGKEVVVLAWGLGLERSILDYYDIKDIRDLYKNDLKQLKEIKSWI